MFSQKLSIFIRFTELMLEDQYKDEAMYCPYQDCSRLLMMPECEYSNPLCYCSECNKKICVFCQVIWHEDFTCAADQALPETDKKLEDLQFLRTAAQKNWQSCPGCKSMVLTNKVDVIGYLASGTSDRISTEYISAMPQMSWHH